MKRVNIAVVGIGNIGSRHTKHAESLGNLIAVCDIKQDRIRGYQCSKYFSLGELLRDKKPDLISICTPSGLHAEHTIAALDAGCNVLCEKPMALTTCDCERMIHAAEKSNKRLFIVKQNRFNPPVVAVKKALDEHKLGKIFDVQVNCFWNRNKEYYSSSDWRGTALDGGVLYTQFSHFIDILLWFIGDIKEVDCFMDGFLHGFKDTGVISFRSIGGTVGTINFTINSYVKNMEGSITLFGENGTVKIGGEYLNKLEYQSIKEHELVVSDEVLLSNRYGSNQGTASNHLKVYKNVIDVLNGKGSIMTDMLDGLKTIEFIERIYNESR